MAGNFEMIGEKIKWRRDLLLGGAMFGLIWILNLTLGLRIGIPGDLPFATSFTDAAVLIVILAGLIEEPFFRIFLLTAQMNIFPMIGIKGFANKATSIITNAIIFSAFHWVAYGASFTRASAAFVGCGTFGLIAGTLVVVTDSIIPSTVAHVGFNLVLFLQKLQQTGSIAFAIAGSGPMIAVSLLILGFQYYRLKRKNYINQNNSILSTKEGKNS